MTWKLETTEPGISDGVWALFKDEETKAASTVFFNINERKYEPTSARQDEIVRGITPEDHAVILAAAMRRR